MTNLTQNSSIETYQRLCEVIPGGVNSPVRACKNLLDVPLIAERACNDMLYDIQGEGYIDYCGSWGALIHGHANDKILIPVIERMKLGTSFGATTEIEGKLARKIIDLMPSIEKIRFVSSGTEATMSAARLARGYTGRDLIIKFNGNYHGHADFFLVNAGSGVFDLNSTSSSAGIPQDIVKNTVSLPYNSIELTKKFIREHGKNIAAVILEPVAGNMGVVPATKEFLMMLREETTKQGSLLIFDEVMCGFRVAKGGAQALYNIDPDLTCLGKIIGGGFPVAAFGGKTSIMDCLAPQGNVYQAGTLSGNPVAMEAGFQALSLLDTPGFYEELERKTSMITQPVSQFIQNCNINACIQRVGSMFTLFFGRKSVANMEEAKLLDRDQFIDFFRYMYEKNIYIPPSQYEAWFVSSAHTDDHLNKTVNAIIEFLT